MSTVSHSHLNIILHSEGVEDVAAASKSADFNAPEHYFPGDTVIGSLLLELKEDKEIEYLSITVQGQAKTSFNMMLEEDLYSDEEPIISETKILEPTKKLKAGGYIYAFQFVLPHGIPCTFEHINGQINYEIVAELKTFGLYSSDLRTEIPLIVHPNVDLNQMNLSDYGDYDMCFDCRLDNTSICPCVSSKAEILRLSLTLPKRFFTMGELIEFSIKIDNATRKPVSYLQLELFKTFTFSGVASFTQVPFQELSVDKACAEVVGPIIPPRSLFTWDDTQDAFLFPVQPEPEATGLGGSCRIIDLQYFLHITAQFEKGCCSAFSCIDQCIPVIVGNIPLTSKSKSNNNNTENKEKDKE